MKKFVLFPFLICCFFLYGCVAKQQTNNDIKNSDMQSDSAIFSIYSQELIRKMIYDSYYETDNEFKHIYFRDNDYKLAVEQKYSYLINDEEIYSFLNWLIINDEIYPDEPNERKVVNEILQWELANFIPTENYFFITESNNLFFRLIRWLNPLDYFLDFDFKYIFDSEIGTDTIFKEQDRDFLFLQFVAIKDTIWHNSFSESELVSRGEEKVDIHYFSIPLFSIDKNYVIIERFYYCGTECAYGGYYVYKRLDNNNWKYITIVHSWIS